MATVADVQVKLDGNAEEYGFTTETIERKLAGGLAPERIAVEYWEAVAARAATLVDTSEQGSSRSLSQLRTNALAQARYWAALVPAAPTEKRRTVIRPIERA